MKVGKFNVSVWDDGCPIWINLYIGSTHIQLSVEDLHDLKYLIEKIERHLKVDK